VSDRWSTFRYFHDYANGWLGDWAVHLVDIVQWAMDTPGPQVVTASGSRFVLDSDIPPD
jgi:predicted dehydrogenase